MRWRWATSSSTPASAWCCRRKRRSPSGTAKARPSRASSSRGLWNRKASSRLALADRQMLGHADGARPARNSGADGQRYCATGEARMGSFQSPKRYGNKTRIDLNQSYQVAYWKERFGVTEEELSEAVHAAGALDRKSTRLNSSHLGISYAVF